MHLQTCLACLAPAAETVLTAITVAEHKLYQDFTRLEINKRNLKICHECRNKLLTSFEFLQLCIKSYEDLKKPEFKCEENVKLRRTRKNAKQDIKQDVLYEESLFLDCLQDDEDPDSDDELPISALQKQLKKTKELYKEPELSTIKEETQQIPAVGDSKINKHLCSECGASFLTSQRLQIHSFTHSGIKNFKCDSCDKEFATKFRLKNHSRVHSGERPFICEICSLTFAQGNALKCHKRVHTKERPYSCKYCSKSFSQNTTLKTHMAALHIGKTIECDEPGCNKKFTRRSYLLLHKRDHAGERKYACDRCPNHYKQKSHLDRHVEASHLGIRHKCDFPGCSSEFSKAWSLKMHKFAHSSEPSQLPYQCSECQTGFQRRDKWLKHVSKMHPDLAVKKVSVEIQEPKVDSCNVLTQEGAKFVVLTSTPEIYTIQNPDGSFTQVQTLVVESE